MSKGKPKLEWSTKSNHPLPPGELITDLLWGLPTGDNPGCQPEDQLILGDNLSIIGALMDQYAGKIDLIYIDPPFFSNKGYAARVGRGEDSRKPEDWQLAEGYGDEWDNLESYLDMLYPRLRAMHQLLSPTGSLFLHLDWHANSYARVLMDEIFGYNNLRNEIIWTYHGPSPIRSAFNRKHDMILFYSKSDHYKFNADAVRVPYAQNTVTTFNSSSKAGFGKVPDLKRGKVPEDWWYFPVVARLHHERTGYPTQKPERLLERIILAATDPGDRVADFFSGAGTTGSVAARLGRRFILSDIQPRALHTARARLILAQSQESSDREPFAPLRVLHEKKANLPPYKTATDLNFPAPKLQGGAVMLDQELAERVLYWEIDPDWNGQVFQSRMSAARPWRKGELTRVLDLPGSTGQICLRIVLVDGEIIQQTI